MVYALLVSFWVTIALIGALAGVLFSLAVLKGF